MALAVLRVASLPDDPQAAAAAFYARGPRLPQGEDVALVFDPAGPAHRDWRLAAVRDLARSVAPARRVNAVVGTDEPALAEVLAYLAAAPGVTGQIFDLDGTNG
jgi:hypothetical protein